MHEPSTRIVAVTAGVSPVSGVDSYVIKFDDGETQAHEGPWSEARELAHRAGLLGRDDGPVGITRWFRRGVALIVAVVMWMTACGPPPPPPPPLPGSSVFVGTQRLDGLVCDAQGCLIVCTATMRMQIRLQLTGATLSSMVDYGEQPDCSPAAWTLQAWVVCEPDCGIQDAPTLTAFSDRLMIFKRVPNLSTLVVHFQGTFNGQLGHVAGRTPRIRCQGTACRFEPT
jgi:hypothetical protein